MSSFDITAQSNHASWLVYTVTDALRLALLRLFLQKATTLMKNGPLYRKRPELGCQSATQPVTSDTVSMHATPLGGIPAHEAGMPKGLPPRGVEDTVAGGDLAACSDDEGQIIGLVVGMALAEEEAAGLG